MNGPTDAKRSLDILQGNVRGTARDGVRDARKASPEVFNGVMRQMGLSQSESEDTKAEQESLIDSIERTMFGAQVTAPHAAPIDGGASEHEITPRDDSEYDFLKFQPSGSNEWVQVKKVDHPGNDEHNYLKKAALIISQDIDKVAGDDINAAIREAGFTQKS